MQTRFFTKLSDETLAEAIAAHGGFFDGMDSYEQAEDFCKMEFTDGEDYEIIKLTIESNKGLENGNY